MTILKRSASMVSALVMMISSAGAYNCIVLRLFCISGSYFIYLLFWRYKS